VSVQAVAVAEAWARQVRAGREQVERVRETGEPDDPYRPLAQRFALDPRRSDDPTLALLHALARPSDVWLDIGAGGGRYALPLAMRVQRVIALDPSPAMIGVLRDGMAEHGVENIEVIEGRWPPRGSLPRADVALMAHVGYDIEDFASFLDAAERAAPRRVAVMRASGAARLTHVLWPLVHGESRLDYPTLSQLVELLAARGASPQVTLVEQGSWGFDTPEQLLAAARRVLYVRPGSARDEVLRGIVDERATLRDGWWDIDRAPMQDGVVSWEAQA
jgi:SAM-dependent methyltransferase